jgi:hypothetical protein
MENRKATATANTGISPLRRKSAPSVEMTVLGVGMEKSNGKGNRRFPAGMTRKEKPEADSLRNGKKEEQRQVQKQIPYGNDKQKRMTNKRE